MNGAKYATHTQNRMKTDEEFRPFLTHFKCVNEHKSLDSVSSKTLIPHLLFCNYNMVAPGSFRFNLEAYFSVSEVNDKLSATKKRGRTVNFSDTVKVHMIPSRKQFSKEEIRDYYLSRNDQDRIRGEIKVCLKRVVKGDLDEKEEEELRGLECYTTPQACHERSQRIKVAIDVVMRQQSSGFLDDEWLSQIYRKLTQYSANSAYVRGLMDQQKNLASPPFIQAMVR
jgi:hypothetical protein